MTIASDKVDWEAQYRARLKQELAGQELDRFSPWARPSAEVYLPRTLLEERLQPESEPGREGEKSTGRDGGKRARPTLIKVPVKELWEKLDSDRVLLLEGPAGMGKTTWSTHLVQAYLEPQDHEHQRHGSVKIPIRIPFRDFVAEGAEQVTVQNYLTRKYAPSLGRWLYSQWDCGQAVLILDGLDEVIDPAERANVLGNLPRMGQNSMRPLTMLTSRPLGQALSFVAVKIELQGLSPQEQRELITLYQPHLERLYQKQIDIDTFLQRVGLRGTKATSSSPVRSLLERPGHLVQLLEVYAKTGEVLETETEVLTHLLTARLTTTGRSHTMVTPADPDHQDKKRLVLETMAFHLLACRAGHPQTRAQLLALIEQVLQEHTTAGTPLFPLTQATVLLNDFIKNSGLLTRVGFDPERFQVESVVWLHYLVGSSLANRQIVQALNWTEAQVVDYLDKKAWDLAEGEPVLKSWMGQADNPFPLFERLIDKTKDDLARHRLGTAGRCLREMPKRLREEASVRSLRDRIALDAFEVWKAEALRGAEELLKVSLLGVWVEMKVVQVELINLLKSSDSIMREKVVKVLAGLGTNMPGEVQKVLVARLADKDEFVNRATVKALEGLGTSISKRVQKELETVVMKGVEPKSFQALNLLARLGISMSEEVKQLWATMVVRLTDEDEDVRKAAADWLSELDDMPEEVLEVAMVQLADRGEAVRKQVCRSLLELPCGTPETKQQLWETVIVQLADEDEAVRRAAADSLKSTMYQLGDDDEAVRRAVAKLLETVMVRLADRNEAVRKQVRKSFLALPTGMGKRVQLEEVDEAVWQAVVARLAARDERVQRNACHRLHALGNGMSKKVQQMVVTLFADSDRDVREAAVWSLLDLGASMLEETRLALVVRLADKDESVREAATWALSRLGASMPEEVLESLVWRLADTDIKALESDKMLSSAQQQGLRLFTDSTGIRARGLVSELSATSFFSDGCDSHEPVHRSFALAPLSA